MRRIALGSFAVLAGLTLVFFAGCTHENALRVVSLNDGNPFFSDLMDYGIVNDEEGDPYTVEIVPDDVCEIGLQYVEVGIGLPTWTPYQANIEQVQVTLSWIAGDEPDELPPLILPLKMSIMADRTGESPVIGTFNILPAWYKENYFDVDGVYVLKAAVKVSGTDQTSGAKLEATSEVQVSVSDYWDDPNSIGN